MRGAEFSLQRLCDDLLLWQNEKRDKPSAGLEDAPACPPLPSLTCFGTTPGQAEKRVALVIGNAVYRATTPLPNPKNDATDVAAALRALNVGPLWRTLMQ
jgi:hypothetical protein